MKEVELLVDAQILMGQSRKLYEMLGRFGDRFPDDIQKELRKEAEDCVLKSSKIKSRVSTRLA